MSERVRRRLLETHRPLLQRVHECADAVAASWGESPPDRNAVVPPFRSTLRETGTLSALAEAWGDSLTHAGYELPARPVPDPPYIVVTSVGVVLRATVGDGRIVATLRTFDVDPYERTGELPEALSVERRER